jgi:hypothetical protein
MFRSLLCSVTLLGFTSAASAGELDRDAAGKTVPAAIGTAPITPSSVVGTEMDRESPQSADRGHGGWGYGHGYGYGGGYGHGYRYGGWGYGGFGYRPYFGGGFGGYYGRGYRPYYGGFSGGFYSSYYTGFYQPSYVLSPYGCYDSIWY